jgi:hypothetical protein
MEMKDDQVSRETRGTVAYQGFQEVLATEVFLAFVVLRENQAYPECLGSVSRAIPVKTDFLEYPVTLVTKVNLDKPVFVEYLETR